MYKQILSCFGLVLLLVGCAKDKIHLEGERQKVFLDEDVLKPHESLVQQDVILPGAVETDEWPQAGKKADHSYLPVFLDPTQLHTVWERSIGGGSSSYQRLLSEPVVANSQIYVLNTNGEVVAIQENTGEILWTQSIIPPEVSGYALGGGVAYENDVLYVASPYAEVIALEAKTGKIQWRHSLNSPVRAAPTVKDGRIFIITINNELEVINATDGALLWSHMGMSETAGVLGTSSPAVSGNVVVVPYSSGEVYALQVENGHPLWSESLTSFRRVDSVSALSHIRARPVIDREMVFLVSHGGRTVALDVRTGEPVWNLDIGGIQTPAVAGNFLFMITSENRVVCLERNQGRVKWVQNLPQFENPETNKGKILWNGPLIVKDTLVLSGSNGEMVVINAQDGKIIMQKNLGDKLLIPPVAAHKSLYFLSDSGYLMALRQQ